jgi:hypothetical protein
MFDSTSHLVDKLRVGDCDLEIWILYIAREAIQVLSHNHLNRVDRRLVLSNLRLEESFVFLTILWRKRIWSCNVEVVKEVGNVKHNRVARLFQSVQACFPELATHLRNTKQFYGSFPIMQRTLLTFNLLKDKTIRLGIEVRQAGARPLLIPLGIVLPQARHILRHLLQHLRLEVRGLARTHLAPGSILRALEARCRRR